MGPLQGIGRCVQFLALRHKMKYRGYIIEKSGHNFYIKDSSGHRAFAEVPANIQTAKKWIDEELGRRERQLGMAAHPLFNGF